VNVKIVVALALLTIVLAPAAYAVGQARDPRVPALERRVATMQAQVRALREQTAIFATKYVNQNIDQRVLAFCQALITTRSVTSPLELQAEPAFSSFLTAVTDEGSSTFACPATTPHSRG
jgi:hypothetical protein